MRNPAFIFGAVLGGAFVAACLNDSFRNTCKQGLIYIGNEASGHLNQIIGEISGKPQNIFKGQYNEHEGISQTQNLPATRCADGHD